MLFIFCLVKEKSAAVTCALCVNATGVKILHNQWKKQQHLLKRVHFVSECTRLVTSTIVYFHRKTAFVHIIHSTKKPVTTMLAHPWKCTVLHCNHLGNIWKPLVLMTQQFDYCPSASEGDNQSVRSSAPVVSRCFPGGYNVKLYIPRGRLAWWLLAFLHSDTHKWPYN